MGFQLIALTHCRDSASPFLVWDIGRGNREPSMPKPLFPGFRTQSWPSIRPARRRLGSSCCTTTASTTATVSSAATAATALTTTTATGSRRCTTLRWCGGAGTWTGRLSALLAGLTLSNDHSGQ
jgi:hypothetical protein